MESRGDWVWGEIFSHSSTGGVSGGVSGAGVVVVEVVDMEVWIREKINKEGVTVFFFLLCSRRSKGPKRRRERRKKECSLITTKE